MKEGSANASKGRILGEEKTPPKKVLSIKQQLGKVIEVTTKKKKKEREHPHFSALYRSLGWTGRAEVVVQTTCCRGNLRE